MENNKDNKNFRPETDKSAEEQSGYFHRFSQYRMRGLMMSGWLIAILLGAVVIVGGAAAFEHRDYNHMRKGDNFYGSPMMGSRFSDMGMGTHHLRPYGSITAKVTVVNGKSFVIDDNGTSRTVAISETTRYALRSSTTVKVGDTVMVVGAKDSSGVIQAEYLSINL